MEAANVSSGVSATNATSATMGNLLFWMSGVMTNLVVVLGLIGNMLAIVILSQRAMRSSTNYYLTALAVWDSVVLICTFLLIGLINGLHIESYEYHVHSYVVAYVYPLALIAQTATIWLTVSFTVERYIAVCHPLKAASMCTISRAKIVIIGVSIGSSLYNIPRWFEYKPVARFHPELNRTVLTHLMTEFSQNPLYLTGYFSCLYVPIMFIIPFLVLFTLNTFLIRAVRQSQRNREMHMNVRQSRENNVTIMLVTVVIVFMICQLPALVYNLAYSIDIDMVTNSFGYYVLSEIRNFMVNLNSAVNFILYCALGQKFRRIFLHTFCRRCLHQNYAPMSGIHHKTTMVTVPSLRQHRFGSSQKSVKQTDAAAGLADKKKAAGCDYHQVTTAGALSTDRWERRRAVEMLQDDTAKKDARKYDFTMEQLLPSSSERSSSNHQTSSSSSSTYPMYNLHLANGTRVAS